MFSQLSNKLDQAFKKITGKGVLREEDVKSSLREIRLALLEADVALPVIKRIINIVKERAVGEEVTKSITPGQQVVKIVNDALVEILGEASPLELGTEKPAVIMMVGLQGSGKTTTTGKLAKKLKEKENKKVLLASLDIYRPAAREQLATLAKRTETDSLEIIQNEKPIEIAKRALKEAQNGNYDVIFLDTAGRLEIDEELMQELKTIKELANPAETLLVADSLSGQIAAKIAETFNEQIGITGSILTRIDGDGRGGAALSMREITKKPIKFLGSGEGLGALENFRPESIANRILGMGDIVSLVEKAQEAASEEDMMSMQEKLFSGNFDLNDMKKQMKMISRMGSMKNMLKLIPGMSKLTKNIDTSKLNDKTIIHQIAIIDSMTPLERKKPQILNAKRKIRIAKGAGVQVSAVNKLIKSHMQMVKMMKKFGGGGMAGIANMLGKGGFPPNMK